MTPSKLLGLPLRLWIAMVRMLGMGMGMGLVLRMSMRMNVGICIAIIGSIAIAIGIDIVIPRILLLVLSRRAIGINIDIHIAIRIARRQDDGSPHGRPLRIRIHIQWFAQIPFSHHRRLWRCSYYMLLRRSRRSLSLRRRIGFGHRALGRLQLGIQRLLFGLAYLDSMSELVQLSADLVQLLVQRLL